MKKLVKGDYCEVLYKGKRRTAIVKESGMLTCVVELTDEPIELTFPIARTKKLDPYILTSLDLMKIARYDLSFSTLTKESIRPEMNYLADGSYKVTLEDYLYVLKKFRASDMEYTSFHDDYFKIIDQLVDRYAINLSTSFLIGIEEELFDGIARRGTIFNHMYKEIEKHYESELASGVVGPYLTNDMVKIIDSQIEDIEQFLHTEKEDITKMYLPDFAKANYLTFWFDKKDIRFASGTYKFIYKKYAEDLEPKGWIVALQALSYGYYGEDAAFGCNWTKSLDYLERLLKKTQDPVYADAIGYIYYNGCIDGTPDYEKAYLYYSMGAFAGIYSSLCMVSDMYLKGQYVSRNVGISQNILYSMVDDVLKRFLSGEVDVPLAEVASRIADQIMVSDTYNSEIYYLVAAYALRKKMKKVNFMDDTKLGWKISERLYEIRENTELEHETAIFEDLSGVIATNTLTGPVKISSNKISENSYLMTITKEKGEMLCVFPDFVSCYTKKELLVEASFDVSRKKIEAIPDEMYVDSINGSHLMYANNEVVDLSGYTFTVYDTDEDTPVFRFCTVDVDGSFRTFFCEDHNTKAGDAVELPDGSIRIVRWTRDLYASEVAVPFDLIKKVKKVIVEE